MVWGLLIGIISAGTIPVNASELDRSLVSAFPGMKLTYLNKIDQRLLQEGETRPPTSGFASKIEYTVLELEDNNKFITLEKKSGDATPSILEIAMDKFGVDIIIVPDWGYWSDNVSDILSTINDSNPANTSLNTEIIDDKNEFGFLVETEIFDNQNDLTLIETTKYTYQKDHGTLNYKRIYSEEISDDNTRQITEIITVAENYNEHSTQDPKLPDLYLIIVVFAITVIVGYTLKYAYNRKKTN